MQRVATVLAVAAGCGSANGDTGGDPKIKALTAEVAALRRELTDGSRYALGPANWACKKNATTGKSECMHTSAGGARCSTPSDGCTFTRVAYCNRVGLPTMACFEKYGQCDTSADWAQCVGVE